jgi:uncharacterized damage-inducible protein DinB
MSPLEHYRAMARYNRWMNRKLFGLVGSLDAAEQKRDRGAFFGSIHRTLNHLLLADRAWMLRLTGDRERYVSLAASGEPIVIDGLGIELYEDFEFLLRERERTDEDIVTWTYSLDEAALDATLEYPNFRGDPQSHLLWWAVAQLFNHQTHHRGQLTTLLMQAGIDPGVTDLIAMLRTEIVPAR